VGYSARPSAHYAQTLCLQGYFAIGMKSNVAKGGTLQLEIELELTELSSFARWLLERTAHFIYVLRILRHIEKLSYRNPRTFVHGHNSGNKS